MESALLIPTCWMCTPSWPRPQRSDPKAMKDSKSESELDELWWTKAGKLVAGYYEQRSLVEKDAEDLKKFFRSQKDMPGKTKVGPRSSNGFCVMLNTPGRYPEADLARAAQAHGHSGAAFG